MAFALSALVRCELSGQPDSTFNSSSALVTGRGIRIWTYNASANGANDTTAATQAAGYFLPATAYLNVGDLIWVVSNDPGYHLIYVATNTGLALTTVQLV